MAEYVLIPTGDGTAKRLPIPNDVVAKGGAAIDAYVAHPPSKALEAAATVPYADPAPEPEATPTPVVDAPVLATDED